jgi:trimeric autotransporter adhesin
MNRFLLVSKVIIVFFALIAPQFLLSQGNPPPARMKEVFKRTNLNTANINSGWEITYLPGDDSLWITEDTAYGIIKMHPSTGGYRKLTDLSEGATAAQLNGIPSTYRRTFAAGTNPWPQGGMMGMAFHPEFMSNAAKRFLYVQYVFSRTSAQVFSSRIVRFTYNTTSGALESPEILVDTIPGSGDHNSGRLIVAPVGGTYYLFSSVGDMGAGQFANTGRAFKSQLLNSYEGKILRFNLEKDGDADQGAVDYNQWIPNDNPYNNIAPVTGQSAVYSIGHRNVQGLAYANGKLYGASHGAFSDDEVNILEGNKNYGHPRIQGYANDGNYNGYRAALSNNPYTVPTPGNPTPTQGGTATTAPLITNEAADALTIPNYQDPIYTFYPAPNGPLRPVTQTTPYSTPPADTQALNIANMSYYNPGNIRWPSIAPSGMDIYTDTKIPGWKNTLMLASLKKGSIVMLKLNADGSGIQPNGMAGADTSYILSQGANDNRFRDIALDPDGWSFYTSVDRRGTTSGPTDVTPVPSECPGCIIKYTFLGYNHSAGTGTIPATIPIDAGTINNCATGTAVTINSTNSNTNLWVPLTGPNGNIIAEINANGNNLGNVTSSFYVQSGSPVRSAAGNNKYLNRNITINVQNQPVSDVSVRLYLTSTELQDMINTPGSGVTSINDIGIFKNNDACGSSISGIPSAQTITGRYTQSTFGHALQATISSFSTFYFMSTSSTLPANVITFKANAVGDAAKLLWAVEDQENVKTYVIERSRNNINFVASGSVDARGNAGENIEYQFTDINAAAFASTVYYRIKIVDKDGNAKYTQVIPVSFETYTRAFVSVQPNPVVNNATVLVTSTAEEMVQLRVTDNTGRVVISKNIRLVKGRNTLELNVNSLTSGLYYIDITGKNINEKTKLIKQ